MGRGGNAPLPGAPAWLAEARKWGGEAPPLPEPVPPAPSDAVLRGYACNSCLAFALHADDIVSTAFHGRKGGALLVRGLHNIRPGAKEDRMLMSGLHTVSDVHCVRCDAIVGWRYDHAHHPSQKYKVGKFVVERTCLTKLAEED